MTTETMRGEIAGLPLTTLALVADRAPERLGVT